MKSTAFTTAALVCCLTQLAFSQELNLDDFKLRQSHTQEYISLGDFKNVKALVIIFTNDQCPYSKLYNERITQLHSVYKTEGVQVILVNSILSPTLKESYTKGIPYLLDEGQRLCFKLGATKTPEAFVFQNSNSSFVLKYKGAIDDNPQIEKDVKQNFLKDAIEAIINRNSLSLASTGAVGCMMKGTHSR